MSEVSVYIKNAPDFSKAILKHLQKIIHQAIPGVEEAIKWNSPSFIYKGEIVCSLVAFKKHVTFTFWRGQEIEDFQQLLEDVGKTNMKALNNIKSLEDLPSDEVLKFYLEQAKQRVIPKTKSS